MTDGFQTPAGIALHPTSGALYVASASSGEIWEYDSVAGDPMIPPAGTGLQQPGGVGFDAPGDFLYFVDPADGLSLNRDAVKRLAVASGNVSSVGGDSAADYSHVAVNGSRVFASDSLNGDVVSWSSSGDPRAASARAAICGLGSTGSP